jgi:large subunit ribosomal protein L13
MQKTWMPKENDLESKWYVIDAAGLPLGRVASEAARILKGKHKPIYTPYLDTGDGVIVLNAARVLLTGRKLSQKYYYRHSGYPGGIRKIRYDELIALEPQKAVYLAVKRMLPGNRLGRAMFKKLKVYPGDRHPHMAQQPSLWEYNAKRVAKQNTP